MKVINYTSQEANISLSDKELEILKRAIVEVKQFISIHEFKLRLEASQAEIDNFFKLINQLIEQVKHNKKNKIKFTFQEVIIINNILNEICNGKNTDFEVKIGASFEEVDCFSLLICKLGKKIYSIQSNTIN
ncbi:MAG: hypothetical protein ACRCXZ_04060 [Patescibacteria group bacterium]